MPRSGRVIERVNVYCKDGGVFETSMFRESGECMTCESERAEWRLRGKGALGLDWKREKGRRKEETKEVTKRETEVRAEWKRGWSGAEHDETGDGSDTRMGIDRVRSRDGKTVIRRRRAERTKQSKRTGGHGHGDGSHKAKRERTEGLRLSRRSLFLQ